MSRAEVASGVVQLVGGLVLAPLLPGLVQHWMTTLRLQPEGSTVTERVDTLARVLDLIAAVEAEK